MLTKKELAEIAARAEAATQGPYSIKEVSEIGNIQWADIPELSQLMTWKNTTRNAIRKNDATFITHARTDIPKLLEEVKRLQDFPLRENMEEAMGMIKRYREALEWYADENNWTYIIELVEPFTHTVRPIGLDHGERARKALEDK